MPCQAGKNTFVRSRKHNGLSVIPEYALLDMQAQGLCENRLLDITPDTHERTQCRCGWGN